MILAAAPREVELDPDTVVVRTPLDVIARIEIEAYPITTIILSGQFAANHVLAAFLRETYPQIRVVAGLHGPDVPYDKLAAFSIR